MCRSQKLPILSSAPSRSRQMPMRSMMWLRSHIAFQVVTVDGQDVELTRSEFDILADLLVAGRRVRAKSDLALMLRGDQYAVSDFVSDSDARAIEVHMANLRRKLGESPAQPRWIETVRGVGYRLTA